MIGMRTCICKESFSRTQRRTRLCQDSNPRPFDPKAECLPLDHFQLGLPLVDSCLVVTHEPVVLIEPSCGSLWLIRIATEHARRLDQNPSFRSWLDILSVGVDQAHLDPCHTPLHVALGEDIQFTGVLY